MTIFEDALLAVRKADAAWEELCATFRAPAAVLAPSDLASEPVEALTAPSAVPAVPAASKRVQLAVILDEMPGQERCSAVQLAKELAPRVGVSEATARKYIGLYRRSAQAA